MALRSCSLSSRPLLPDSLLPPPPTPFSPLSVFCLSPFLLSTQSYVIEVWMRNSQRLSEGTAAWVCCVRSLPLKEKNNIHQLVEGPWMAKDRMVQEAGRCNLSSL